MSISETFFSYWRELDEHKDWIDLGMGMPPIDLFLPVRASQSALVQGVSQRADYQPQAGPLDVRKKIASYETKRMGINYSADNIMLVAGALRGFSLTLDNLVTSSSTLLEVVPTYPLLSGYARNVASRFGCKLKTVVPLDGVDFTIQGDEILPHINDSTILYITNPNNPTGRYMDERIVSKIIDACEKTNSYFIVDESCDIPLSEHSINYGNTHSPSLIRIQSFAKTLLLAGFRAGYIVADADIVRRLSSHYAFSDANAPIVVNNAISDFLQSTSPLLDVTRVSRIKVDQCIPILKSMPRVQHVIVPEGCYYVFLKVNYPHGSWRLFKLLLDLGVNVVPGILFGVADDESWVRIGCAHKDEDLIEGLNRVASALSSIST